MRVAICLLLLACRAEPGACVGARCDSGQDLDGPIDADGDGWAEGDDCDDGDGSIHPGADEVPYDGIDQDCFDGDLLDVDEDGYGIDADCDDDDPTVYPGAEEVPYDGIDQDCDDTDLTDVDGDGWEYTEDCDDQNAGVSPNGVESPETGIDEDCDGTTDEIFVCPELGDYATVQEAVDAAPDGGVVEICPGTYLESVTLPDQSLTIRGLGEDAEAVVLDAGGADYALFGQLTEADALVLERIRLTGSLSFAVAVEAFDSTSRILLTEVSVSGLRDGTALYLFAGDVGLDLVRVSDGDNPDSGPAYPYAFIGADASATISRSSFVDIASESASACAIAVDGLSVAITNTVIARNTVSYCGIFVGYTASTSVELINNTLADNTMGYEDDSSVIFVPGVRAGLDLKFYNNVFVGNSADWLFSVSWDWCNLDIPTSSFRDAFQYNLDYGSSGGQVLNPANNADSDCGYWEYTSGCTCRNYGTTDVQSMYTAGGTNMTADPEFSDSEYRTLSGSAVEDAGHPDTQFNDLDGSRNDLGRYGGPLGD